MVVGIVWSLIVGNAWILVAAVALLIVSCVMVWHARRRLARRDVLEVRTDRLELVEANVVGQGLAPRRSGVAWTDVDSLVTVRWRGWPWLAVRCRDGYAPDGAAWHELTDQGVHVLTTLTAWDVPAQQLQAAVERASGLSWHGELTADEQAR